MSVSRRFVEDPENIRRVLQHYGGPEKPTIQETAQALGTTFHNVQNILATHLHRDALKAEQALRYSRSKTGPKNPMQGKSGPQHPQYVGVVEDGHGYLMEKVDGKYQLVHRTVMARALGLRRLPSFMEVHHIDKDKHNNDLDNLALATKLGHRHLHGPKTPRSARLTLWEQWESGTSRSPVTIPTEPAAF